VAWDEQVKGGQRVVIARGTVDGEHPVRFTRQAVGDESGSSPAIASLRDATIVAWTEGARDDAGLRIERFPTKR
jgi:hypothetical protein